VSNPRNFVAALAWPRCRSEVRKSGMGKSIENTLHES
jgi:hypothetical protein